MKNLVPPVKTTEEARKRGANGGRKSGKVRREKRLLSDEYAKHLARLYDAKPGESLSLGNVIVAVLSRADSASVAMLREMREATEGNKLAISGDSDAPPVAFKFVEPKGK